MKNQRQQKEEGFSLTEILIALVILGIAAVAILNGLSTDSNIRGRSEQKVSQFQKLVNASELIAGKQFIPCNSESVALDNPYGPLDGIKDNPNAGVGKNSRGIVVEYLDPQGTWKPCSVRISGFTEVVQKITLSIWDEKQLLQKREILKTYKGSAEDGGTPVPVEPLVISASKTNVTVAENSNSKCGNSDVVSLENSADLSGIVYIANIVPTGAGQASASVSGEQVTISGTIRGSANLEIRGVDPRNGSESNTLTIPITITESFEFTPPTNQVFVQGLPRVNSKANLLQYVSASETTKNALSFSIEKAEDRNNFELTSILTGSSKSVFFNSKEIAPTNSNYRVQIRISDSRLPLTVTDPNCIPSGVNADWRIGAKINPRLSFTVLNTTNGCQLNGVTGATCSVVISFVPNSGSGDILTGNQPENQIQTLFNFTNNTFAYAGSIGILNSSACSVMSKANGRIYEVKLVNTGDSRGYNLQFTLVGSPSNLLVGEIIQILYTPSGGSLSPSDPLNNLNSNSAQVVQLTATTFRASGRDNPATLVTTNHFVAQVTSLSNSQQNNLTFTPISLPSFTPSLVDSNFGNSYIINSGNEITPIKCI